MNRNITNITIYVIKNTTHTQLGYIFYHTFVRHVHSIKMRFRTTSPNIALCGAQG